MEDLLLENWERAALQRLETEIEIAQAAYTAAVRVLGMRRGIKGSFRINDDRTALIMIRPEGGATN